MNGKFKFWCPIEKSVTSVADDTSEQMVLGGIASTADKDSDGEYLDPNGFDITPLMQNGTVNWHHQAKGQPAAIIGEPIRGEIRPEGLYLETKLYPSSPIARDVWQLATTLERDSSTRRLGYSIEGRVIERASSDPNNPDYKRVTKAVITGVAVTHMPKNAQTFANIIKGEGCEDDEECLYDEEDFAGDEHEEKSMTTESAAALRPESLQRDIKNQTFSKAEVYDIVLQTLPNITIAKAETIVSLIESIAKMKKTKQKQITDNDICKAYEALGLEAPDTLNKSIIDEIDSLLNKGEDDEPLEDEDEDVEDEDVEKGEDGDEDGDDDLDDYMDDEDYVAVGEMAKGGIAKHFQRLEKAIAISHYSNTKYIKALGELVKSQSDEISDLNELIKAQEETIAELTGRVEGYGSRRVHRAARSVRTAERNFAKSEGNEDEDEIKKGGGVGISMSRQRAAVAEILDQATFAKGGYDEEFSKACLSFESSGVLPATIIARLKNEFGVDIVK